MLVHGHDVDLALVTVDDDDFWLGDAALAADLCFTLKHIGVNDTICTHVTGGGGMER